VLHGHVDSIELHLHGGCAPKLELDLAPLSLDLNSLLLEEPLLFFNLRAERARTRHMALLLS
jgi:hypothetical protein